VLPRAHRVSRHDRGACHGVLTRWRLPLGKSRWQGQSRLAGFVTSPAVNCWTCGIVTSCQMLLAHLADDTMQHRRHTHAPHTEKTVTDTPRPKHHLQRPAFPTPRDSPDPMPSPPWLLLPPRAQETLRHQHLPALAPPWTTALRRHTRPKRHHAVGHGYRHTTQAQAQTDTTTYKDMRGQQGRLLETPCTRTHPGRTCSPLPYACRSPRRARWQRLSHQEVSASRRHVHV
jgi:hypothetical protein